MGVFDGLHRGHAALLAATREAALARDARSVALVFDPHPEEVLRPGTLVPRLLPPDEVTRRIVADCGVDLALPLRFDEALRTMPAEDFLAALGPALELRALVMTPESAFGARRGGTVETMTPLGVERGFEVVVVDPVEVDGAAVSSSRIRDAMGVGDIDGAARLLGRPPQMVGTVVVGDRRGRSLGYPTANLAFDHAVAMPPLGIYVGHSAIPERGVPGGHPSLVSIGVRPTFHTDGQVLVEVHLLDFDGDLYGARLELELLTRLREELRFDSAAALVAQMHDDERQARDWLRRI
jgi:riboflavin kinase/FMN adenylyltransferase